VPDAPLHLYLVERIDDVGPGEMAGYVACARSEAEALSLAPAGGFGASMVTVTHLGIAVNGASPGVVLASFEAGGPAPPPVVLSDPDHDPRPGRG
jgi:hypothetical protein